MGLQVVLNAVPIVPSAGQLAIEEGSGGVDEAVFVEKEAERVVEDDGVLSSLFAFEEVSHSPDGQAVVTWLLGHPHKGAVFPGDVPREDGYLVAKFLEVMHVSRERLPVEGVDFHDQCGLPFWRGSLEAELEVMPQSNKTLAPVAEKPRDIEIWARLVQIPQAGLKSLA